MYKRQVLGDALDACSKKEFGMGVFSDILAEFKTNLAATSSKDNSSRGSLFRERVTEGVEECFFWMDKTAKEAVLRAALVEKPEDFGTLHGLSLIHI